MMNGFLISAPQSGSGKTTVSLAIMAGLKRRGLSLAPFKCGPDFIDTGYHRLASGRTSVNLDAWMCPAAFVGETFALHAADADIAIIEGVMGLFDGLGASPMEGSSAQIAAITGAPVVLVVNARGMAASISALVKGFAEFDRRVNLAGVIFNNVGSITHGDLLRHALAESLPKMSVFGCIPRDESLDIPSRHLGLITVEDNPLPPEYLDNLADFAEQYLDLDALARLEVTIPSAPFRRQERWVSGVETRIAVASDAAFCFVYEDNLRLLREAGAEIIPFSPLNDSRLPAGISGIYLPGGYPELYAGQLAANAAMIRDIRSSAERDMPMYAECGGFIYLTQGMADSDGAPLTDFVGLFPVRARMLPKRKALGYRQVDYTTDTFMATTGQSARGHEFHYSEINRMPDDIQHCYQVTRQGRDLGPEGYRVHNCLASYIHLHFGSQTGMAAAFVAACRDYLKIPGEIH